MGDEVVLFLTGRVVLPHQLIVIDGVVRVGAPGLEAVRAIDRCRFPKAGQLGKPRLHRTLKTGSMSPMQPETQSAVLWTMSSSSMAASRGRALTPTAERTCLPAGPKIFTSRSLAPLATLG